MSTPRGTVRVRDLLGAIHQDCAGVLELRLKFASRVRRVFIDPGDTAALANCVEENQNADIWFGVATRRDRSGGALTNCQHLGALFVDLDCPADGAGRAAALQRMAAFPLPPSIVVDSGGCFHCYWLLREPADVQSEQSAIYAMLRRLRVALDGDPAAAEPARVLRLPGTWNHKYTPRRPVTIRAFEPSRRYNLQEFDAVLPEDCGKSARGTVDLSELSVIM